MPIGIGEDHEELRRTVRRWLDTRCPPEVPRALLDAETETMPPFWHELAGQGWLGIHVPEEYGGQGFGMLELAVVVEEMARAVMPGPALPPCSPPPSWWQVPTTPSARPCWPPWSTGAPPPPWPCPARALSRAPGPVTAPCAWPVRSVPCSAPCWGNGCSRRCRSRTPRAPGPGTLPPWCGAASTSTATKSPSTALSSLDPTRRVGAVRSQGSVVVPERQLPSVSSAAVRDLALVLAAAECAGGARWCLDVGTAYALERRQFGRPIGQFQAVKHRLADMLVAVEQVTALAWDAAQAADAGDAAQAALSAVLAGAFALDAYVECAKGCIQVLGGMGFTWEHDAHLHLRRALTLRQLVGRARRLAGGGRDARRSGRSAAARARPPRGGRAIRGAGPRPGGRGGRGTGPRGAAPAPGGHGPAHAALARALGAWRGSRRAARHRRGARRGRRAPAAPGRRRLGPAHHHRPRDPEQQERWVGPTLRGELVWCQLFSEPGAGSDLAALSTRATGVDGGWVLTGQKVWTSIALRADWGICLARTDPDAPKHEGITYFLVDMHSDGIEVRPLREITGAAMFNEVFFTDVFVPDDCVVGEVNGGWRLARTTLANERVSMAAGATSGFGIEGILKGIKAGGTEDSVVLDGVGGVAGRGAVAGAARCPDDPAVRVGCRARSRGERAQAARRRARATSPGVRARPARPHGAPPPRTTPAAGARASSRRAV